MLQQVDSNKAGFQRLMSMGKTQSWNTCGTLSGSVEAYSRVEARARLHFHVGLGRRRKEEPIGRPLASTFSYLSNGLVK